MRLIDWPAEFAAMPYPHDPALCGVAADWYEEHASDTEGGRWFMAYFRERAAFWAWVLENGWGPERADPFPVGHKVRFAWYSAEKVHFKKEYGPNLPHKLWMALPEDSDGDIPEKNIFPTMWYLSLGEAWDALFVAWRKEVYSPSLSQQKEAVK